MLLPAFDSWRSGGDTDAPVREIARTGTLDWLFEEYRADRRFTLLHVQTRRKHEAGFNLIGGYVLKGGERLGEARLASITSAFIDALYEKLLIVKETDVDGNVIERERRTTINDVMRSCRRAWNVVSRRDPGKVPLVNPFARMELQSSNRTTPTATFEELQTFRQGDRDGIAVPRLYPELMSQLDAIKRDRIGGLMLTRDWGDRRPWPFWPTPDDADLTHMRRKVKEIIRAAVLRDELTFTSFRHGGFTEAADADLTEFEIRTQGRHRSAKVLPRYAKRTMKQVAEGARKDGRREFRRANKSCPPSNERTEKRGEQKMVFCQKAPPPACQNGATGMTQVLEMVRVGFRSSVLGKGADATDRTWLSAAPYGVVVLRDACDSVDPAGRSYQGERHAGW
jgi:hypothetical protein